MFRVLVTFLAFWLPLTLATGHIGKAILPSRPLSTTSRWVVDPDGNRVKLRCVNWAGHIETNTPEGLQHQSVEYISSWISSHGFNCVRLTYSVDMTMMPFMPVQDSFMNAAIVTGANSTQLMGQFDLATVKNPWIKNATLIQTFAKVIDTLGHHGIMTILDNQVSKASWCCDYTDGNGWWDTAPGYIASNSRYFNTSDWLSSLAFMARFSKQHPSVVGMSLRNEMRALGIQDTITHSFWYGIVTQGAQTIHTANPDLLIAIGGVTSDTDLDYLRANPLDTSSWPNKTLWEWHTYEFSPAWIVTMGNCGFWKQYVGAFSGFLLEQDQKFTGPLWLSEFGGQQLGTPPGSNAYGLADQEYNYFSCVADYMSANDADWALWVLGGSYYVRDGQVDYDELWGLLDSNWSDWRNPKFAGVLGSMWNVTQGPGVSS